MNASDDCTVGHQLFVESWKASMTLKFCIDQIRLPPPVDVTFANCHYSWVGEGMAIAAVFSDTSSLEFAPLQRKARVYAFCSAERQHFLNYWSELARRLADRGFRLAVAEHARSLQVSARPARELLVTSVALNRWTTVAQTSLDEIASAHTAVGGSGPGRRYATLQVNHAYAMLISSQFQGFCRDLHTEAVDVLVGCVQPKPLAAVLQAVMVQGRKLDQGNPNPGHLGADFSRLGMLFWPQVNALNARSTVRQRRLEELNIWRNAIAHQDWTRVGPALQLKTVERWRSNCSALARTFDLAVGGHLARLVGRRPW